MSCSGLLGTKGSQKGSQKGLFKGGFPELSGTESRIANCESHDSHCGPGISPEIPQREAKNKWNHSKVKSRKIGSELPSESHPINA